MAAAVSEHTVFLDPRTVEQTGGHPVFPVVRDMIRRGQFGTLPHGSPVLPDDNTTPTATFLWAAGTTKGLDVQYNHVWTDSQNPALYTALWNLCATPAFLAKTTDGQNHHEVLKGSATVHMISTAPIPRERARPRSLTASTTSYGRLCPIRCLLSRPLIGCG